jgi:hypothetical protein
VLHGLVRHGREDVLDQPGNVRDRGRRLHDLDGLLQRQLRELEVLCRRLQVAHAGVHDERRLLQQQLCLEQVRRDRRRHRLHDPRQPLLVRRRVLLGQLPGRALHGLGRDVLVAR